MKSLTFKILIISIIFCVSVSCERKYEEDLIDSYFGERCYFDSVNPKYPMKISIDKKYYYMNNQYFKRLTIIDELYDNDTIVDYYIRFDGKKILSYIGENSKDKFFIDFNYNNYKSFKTTFEIRSFLAYNMVKIENTDTIVVFSLIPCSFDSHYDIEFTKQRGVVKMTRDYLGGNYEID